MNILIIRNTNLQCVGCIKYIFNTKKTKIMFNDLRIINLQNEKKINEYC